MMSPVAEEPQTWDAPSPTDSACSEESSSSSSPATTSRHTSTISPAIHAAPSSSPVKHSPTPKPQSRPNVITRQTRPRGLGLTPISANTSNALPLGTGALPKSQPLSRALFARMANDVPHAGVNGMGSGGKKKSGGQKMIVPTKSFKTTFELDLSASELARRS